MILENTHTQFSGVSGRTIGVSNSYNLVNNQLLDGKSAHEHGMLKIQKMVLDS